MILTDAGINSLTDSRDALVSWLLSVAGLRYSVDSQGYIGGSPAGANSTAIATPAVQPGAVPFQMSADADSLTPREQKARVVALRGLSQARVGQYEEARVTFGDAIRLDPELDLRRLPSFWRLPGRAHDAVIEALYDADRRRDAASLIADLRTKFRPRLLPNRKCR